MLFLPYNYRSRVTLQHTHICVKVSIHREPLYAELPVRLSEITLNIPNMWCTLLTPM
jgi:hypothetical protein